MQREFTATAYILHDKKILLIFHPKFHKWLPPGGHVEKNETPPEAAKREVKEETGLEIELIKQENIWMNYSNTKSIERPYLCLLSQSPPHQDKPPHEHIDNIYLARPLPNSPTALLENCRWFSLEELAQLKAGIDIFQDTLDIIQHLTTSVQNDQTKPLLLNL